MKLINYDEEKQLIAEALQFDDEILKFAGEEIRKDRAFILQLLNTRKSDLLRYIHDDLRKDKEFALEAITKTKLGFNRECFDESLYEDRDFVFKAVMVNPYIFSFASEELKADKEFVLGLAKRLLMR